MIKKTLYKISQYFPKPYEPFASNLADLKSEVDKLDVDKLKPIPTGLSKISDVVKMMLLKRLIIINYLLR